MHTEPIIMFTCISSKSFLTIRLHFELFITRMNDWRKDWALLCSVTMVKNALFAGNFNCDRTPTHCYVIMNTWSIINPLIWLVFSGCSFKMPNCEPITFILNSTYTKWIISRQQCLKAEQLIYLMNVIQDITDSFGMVSSIGKWTKMKW